MGGMVRTGWRLPLRAGARAWLHSISSATVRVTPAA